MRKILIMVMALSFFLVNSEAQVYFKTEYLGKSAYKDINNKKNGGEGGAVVYSGAVQIPLSFDRTEDGRVKGWGLTLNSSYTYLSNNPRMEGLSPDRIFNNRIGILNIRPLWKKWSLFTAVGAGIYAPHTKIGKTRFEEVLFDGAALFVWHLRDNLDIGAGVAFNSSFGYPMGFPAVYIRWTTTGKYFVDLQMMDGMTFSAGRHLGRWLTLSLVADVNGSVAMQRIDGKKNMFTHSYTTVSLQPELRIGKHITVPVRAGASVVRTAYYEERTLRAFFKGYRREYDPHFHPSFYMSAGINISF